MARNERHCDRRRRRGNSVKAPHRCVQHAAHGHRTRLREQHRGAVAPRLGCSGGARRCGTASGRQQCRADRASFGHEEVVGGAGVGLCAASHQRQHDVVSRTADVHERSPPVHGDDGGADAAGGRGAIAAATTASGDALNHRRSRQRTKSNTGRHRRHACRRKPTVRRASTRMPWVRSTRRTASASGTSRAPVPSTRMSTRAP